MTEQEIFEKLLPSVQEVTGARAEQITMQTCLMEDLGAESIDLPSVLNVAVFVHVIERKLAEAKQEAGNVER